MLELANIGGIPTGILIGVPMLILFVWLPRRYGASTLCNYFADRNRGIVRVGWKVLYIIALLIGTIPRFFAGFSPGFNEKGFDVYDGKVKDKGDERAAAIIERWEQRNPRLPAERRSRWVSQNPPS